MQKSRRKGYNGTALHMQSWVLCDYFAFEKYMNSIYKSEKLFSIHTCRITGSCSHTVAVIYQLTHYKNLGLTDVPSELACTSIPQQWHKPRGPKIDPEPVTAMVFAKPKPTPRKKKPVQSIPLDNSIPDVTAEHQLEALHCSTSLTTRQLKPNKQPWEMFSWAQC
ncbi:hypothetical protein KUTeg_007064 [Tegillarca granosa]|uniref:Uncharacterized protein n=1 Tax=Tegillarca granosa TaxID=220873 RepID=A0ABQ9FC71_TEGGR|nr:hypothetical protein KUTeg_007064 [Tegillarca granosa]